MHFLSQLILAKVLVVEPTKEQLGGLASYGHHILATALKKSIPQSNKSMMMQFFDQIYIIVLHIWQV